jgi:hypothetical protein
MTSIQLGDSFAVFSASERNSEWWKAEEAVDSAMQKDPAEPEQDGCMTSLRPSPPGERTNERSPTIQEKSTQNVASLDKESQAELEESQAELEESQAELEERPVAAVGEWADVPVQSLPLITPPVRSSTTCGHEHPRSPRGQDLFCFCL